MPPGDPVLFAAKQGQTIFAEPVSGVGGRAIKARLSRLGPGVGAAFMVPIRIDERLVAFVEAGRAKAFRAEEVARAERLVDVLLEAIERCGWPRAWRASAEPAASSAP
jgi:hypothetical protein